MPVSSPAARSSGFRLVAMAALTFVAAIAPTVTGLLGLPSHFAADSGAAADGFACEQYRPVGPAGGVARSVSTQQELIDAMAAAGPGDTINLATGYYTRINYRRDLGHRSGTAAAPIVIQAAPGATPVVDPGENGQPSRRFAVAIDRVAHVSVRGLEIRNGMFGALSRGSSSVTFEHNRIHRSGQVGVATGAAEGPNGLEPSSNTVIRCNSIHHTGLLEPEYGEGIYVGTGRTGAVDRTAGVLIEGNDIHSITNEAIDVKRYTTDVTIRHNLVHDVTPYYGGAISLGLNKNHWGPANYLVEHNRIWNVSTGRHYAQAIAVAHGPTVIRGNVVWNIDTRVSDSWPWTSAIQVHGDDNGADWAYGFGNSGATAVEITGNTVIGCKQGCIDSFTDPGQITPLLTVHSNIVDRAATGDAANGGDFIVSAADLVGPVTGSADSGSGPGSGLRLRPSPPTTVTPTTTAAPPASATTSTSGRRSTTASSSTSEPRRSPSAPTSEEPAPVAPTSGRPKPADSASASPRSASPPSANGNPGQRRRPTSPSAVSSIPDRVIETAGPTPGRKATRSSRSSTTRPTPEPFEAPDVAPGWRRGPSDLRLFLDINLGPYTLTPTDSTDKLTGPPPNPPGWLAAMMAPAGDPGPDPRSTTTISDEPQGRSGNATTSTGRSDDVASRVAPARGDLPSTTRPASTGGLTTVGDAGERTTMP